MHVGMIAFHYPKAQHRDEMIQRVMQAAVVMTAVPGCLAVDCWNDPASGAVVTTGKWVSKEALEASFHAVRAAGVDIDYDDREARARDIFSLLAV
jgi:quinol monooxygenase YgiN